MSESTKFCIQHLDKSGEGLPGPMLVRSYDPEKDRYTWADTTAGQIDWTTVAQFDTREQAEQAVNELPDHVHSRFAVIEVSIP
jgi:hypothetical protein